MLPVSAEFPVVQYREYTPYNPPIVPQIQVNQLCQQLLPVIAAKAANMVAVLANQNPARMFCYNLLCSNGWNNTEFAEVCKFTTDLMFLLFNKQPTRSIEQYIEGAVENALRFKTSQYVSSFPELQQMCTQEVYRSSMDNLNILSQLLTEIDYVYRQNSSPQVMTGPMQNMQGSMNMGITTGQIGLGSQQFSNRSGVIPSFYGTQQNTGVQFGNNQQSVSLASLQTDRFAGRSSGQSVTQPVQEFTPSEEKKPLNLVIDPKMTNESKPNIQFSGMLFSTDNVVKLSELIQDIRDSVMTDSDNEIVSLSDTAIIGDSENVIKVQNDEEYIVKKSGRRCLKKEFALEASMEDMVMVGKIYYLENEIRNNKRSFYRIFGSIANGYIAIDNFEGIIPKWKNCMTFRSLIQVIKSDVEQLSAWQNQLSAGLTSDRMKEYFEKTRAPKDMQQFNGLICAMSHILTKAINDFLKFVLNTNIQIDSFIEDAEDLESYLQKKLTEPQFMVFQSWQKHFLAEFHNSESRVYEDAMFDLPEKVHFYALPTLISMAYVPFNRTDELNVKLKVGESTMINQKDHPVLWELCRTINLPREEFNAAYSDDYVITINDERLQIFETIANGGQFIVQKLK